MNEELKNKNAEFTRSEFPKDNIESALKVAQALEDKNSGNPLPPQEVAIALGRSPGSSAFRILLSSSIKYGLTTGSFNMSRIALTSLGKDIVEPKDEESRKAAIANSVMKPEMFAKVFDYYKGKKIPDKNFFENTLVRDFGIPKKQANIFVEIFMSNMEYLGLIKQTTTGPWFASELSSFSAKPQIVNEERQQKQSQDIQNDGGLPIDNKPTSQFEKSVEQIEQKVFISHGHNKEIVAQLKELLTFGKFEPVIAEEDHTTSIPVPEKVLNAMKNCFAGIIHVEGEQKMTDTEGKEHLMLNQNVLIEIGVALALYGRNTILLVEKGSQLPSNLHGLYRCEYEGKKLDYDATMRLLKTFNELARS